jgi:hypothetical protein
MPQQPPRPIYQSAYISIDAKAFIARRCRLKNENRNKPCSAFPFHRVDIGAVRHFRCSSVLVCQTDQAAGAKRWLSFNNGGTHAIEIAA